MKNISNSQRNDTIVTVNTINSERRARDEIRNEKLSNDENMNGSVMIKIIRNNNRHECNT